MSPIFQGGHARTTITADYLAQQLGLIIGGTTIERILFVNDLRQSLHGVFQIREVMISGILGAVAFGVPTF